MKYKKGDKVRVKPLEELQAIVGNWGYPFAGKTLIIKQELSKKYYFVENSRFAFMEEMFSGLAEETEISLPKELNINGLIYMLKE